MRGRPGPKIRGFRIRLAPPEDAAAGDHRSASTPNQRKERSGYSHGEGVKRDHEKSAGVRAVHPSPKSSVSRPLAFKRVEGMKGRILEEMEIRVAASKGFKLTAVTLSRKTAACRLARVGDFLLMLVKHQHRK